MSIRLVESSIPAGAKRLMYPLKANSLDARKYTVSGCGYSGVSLVTGVEIHFGVVVKVCEADRFLQVPGSE